jgi:hypothetical protein
VLPIQTTALKLADKLAASMGWLSRPMAAQGLMRRAQRHTGLNDFGEDDLLEPLQLFLDSCVADASLSLVGRLATQWDVQRFLVNLLRLRAMETACPAILEERIERPIFIAGLPRSGTTFLHRMMLADAANRGPLVYETIYPYPESARGGDRRAARVARQLAAFERLAPEFRPLHPLDADSPQECSEITAHVFRSLRFESNYHVPTYRAWLDAHPRAHLTAYRFHKRFLQHLQYQSRAARPARWVLKCPEHLFALPAIRAVYPDARLVFAHRDPVKVLLSVAQLTEVLRRPFTRTVDKVEIGRNESARWFEGTRRMVETGDDAGLAEPVCHVHHLDLVSDPLSTVESVYRHFGLALGPAAEAAMTRHLAAHPNGGYGRHEYRFEDHGLDAVAERAKFRPYMLRFGITPETAPARRDSRKLEVPVQPVGT